MTTAASRVLITADAVGGVWQYAIDLARALPPFGIEPVVAILGPPPSPAQRAAAGGVRLIDTGLPLDWLCADAAPVLAAGAAIAALAVAEGAACVQLNMPTLAAGAAFPVPVVAVAHGCVATWWEAAHGTPLGADYHWHRDLTRIALARADRVVAPSAAYAAVVARHYALPAVPTVVHNARRPLRPRRAKAMHDYVFHAGRLWDQVKNAAVLDRAAARLAVPFYAAGPATGPHGETVVLEALHLLGTLSEDEVDRRLAARPVFVSATRFEPFGLAVLEAAGAGCALVLSDIATFRELWDGAALFVPADDDAAFADAIQSVIGDDARRIALGAAARARADRYTPAAMANRMAHIYAEVTGRPLAARRSAA